MIMFTVKQLWLQPGGVRPSHAWSAARILAYRPREPMRRAMRVTLCLLLLPVHAALANQDAVQVAVQVVGPEEIPRTGYQTWSLFLVCTPDWVMPERSGELAGLYRRFQGFGDAIGRDNVAVWFWKEATPINDSRLSENIDVARSADYCQALSLRPSEGPFLVVTTAYPEVDDFPEERAVFVLGGLQPAELARLLNTLTDQLLIEGEVAVARIAAESAASAELPPTATENTDAGLWIRLLEGARRSMIGFGCAVKMQISTGILTAELRGCPG